MKRSEKKLNPERRERRENRKAKRKACRERRQAFFFRHRKPIAITFAVLYFSAATVGALAGIIGYVFDHEKITVGEPAANVLYYDKSASAICRKHSLGNIAYGLNSDYDVFQQASLPIGCGDLGAAVFGETDVERIVFNEKTLWSGGPTEGQTDYNGGNAVGTGQDGLTESERFYAVQSKLLAGDTKEATKLFMNMEGDIESKGSYLSWGNIYLDFGHKSVRGYSRTLDLDNAVAAVSYTYKKHAYTREYIASNPDKVVAIRLTAEGTELDFTVSFPSSQSGATVQAVGNGIINCGTLSDNGLKFYSLLAVDANGGNAVADGSAIRVSGTSEAYIYVSAATDYEQDFPVYRTGESADELAARVKSTVNAAAAKGYENVKADHVADYSSLFNRVSVNLGGVRPRFTTDTLLTRYNTVFLRSSHRKYLEQLLYNYGRYLLISSSRADSLLPANLQGVWNATNKPAWQSDYHLNVNLQMNYWLAYNTNLAECANPLVEYVDALREPGRITAKTYTATAAELAAGLLDEEYGFVAHTESNPYGHTSPGSGKYVKSLWSQAAVAWLMQNLYEGYEYGQDETYLARVYPIMKEALLYFERTMVEYGGRLVTAPAYSPEHGPITAGNTYEQSLVWQLVNDTIEASSVLGVDEDKRAEWTEMKAKLNPIEIGAGGQIKEWYEETCNWSMGMPFHRHTSNLLGLFPGDLINKDEHPEWITAAQTSLNWRGSIATGWAMGQRINTLARIGNGNGAYKMIKSLFLNGIYPNLFDAHPPFQIDGNFGYTAGVTEMLMQSNLGCIELLPALPDDWAVGKASGLVARGNFTLSFSWQDGKITSAALTSGSGKDCTLRFPGASTFTVEDSDGNPVSAVRNGNKLTFSTEAGKTYRVVRGR